jgi:muramoyltetrapeptide carboxypeptidase
MARNLLIPALPAGATLGVIAPAGPPKPGRLGPVPRLIEAQGYRAKLYPGCFGPPHLEHLAAPDAQRLADLHAAFADPEVDAVLALRGGYGCLRLLDRVDTALLRQHPKLLIGYSDLTALHAVLDQQGLPALHAPMPASDWLAPGGEADAAALFERLRLGWAAGEEIGPAPPPHPLNRPGRAHGRLIGGNLAVFTALLGTPFLPDCRGAILFLEDVSEEPYRVDRLLTQLRLGGVLDAAAGFVLGSFTESGVPDAVLADRLGTLDKPVLAGWPSGHGQPNRPLPLGLMAELDADARSLRLA